MPPSIPPSPYDDFASVYDAHWSGRVAKDFNSIIKRLLLPSIQTENHVLDVCCGTGRTAQYLLGQNLRVTGIDASEAMLKLARHRTHFYTRRRAHAADFIHSRIEDAAPLPRPADAAVCLFDSLNHFLTLPKLRQVFDFVYRSLKPGSRFLFDINTEAAFHHRWLEHYTLIEPETVVAVEGNYNPDTQLARYDFATFRRHQTAWHRTDFTIRERCYPITTIKRELFRHNFKLLHQLDAETDLNLHGHTGRTFFVVSRT